MYIDTIKSRVQAFFRHLDISQKEFNASIGVKAGFINTDSEPTGQILSHKYWRACITEPVER